MCSLFTQAKGKEKGKNMAYQLIGINRHKRWSYEGREGYNQRLYFADCSPLAGEQSEGHETFELKVPLSVETSHMVVGSKYDIKFNRYRNPEAFYLVENEKGAK